MNKKIYLCNMEWTQTYEEFGGIKGEFVLKENVSYKDYEKLLKKDLFICDYDLQQENKQLKERVDNILSRYRFIRNRVNQGMTIENRNKCLIELGNNILQELEKGENNE